MYQQAEMLASFAQRSVPDVLLDALALTLPQGLSCPTKSITVLSDEEILTQTQSRLQLQQSQRLSRLLNRQREGELTTAERTELLALMQVYHQIWLQQSAALAEAVRRGSIEPMRP